MSMFGSSYWLMDDYFDWWVVGSPVVMLGIRKTGLNWYLPCGIVLSMQGREIYIIRVVTLPSLLNTVPFASNLIGQEYELDRSILNVPCKECW